MFSEIDPSHRHVSDNWIEIGFRTDFMRELRQGLLFLKSNLAGDNDTGSEDVKSQEYGEKSTKLVCHLLIPRVITECTPKRYAWGLPGYTLPC